MLTRTVVVFFDTAESRSVIEKAKLDYPSAEFFLIYRGERVNPANGVVLVPVSKFEVVGETVVEIPHLSGRMRKCACRYEYKIVTNGTREHDQAFRELNRFYVKLGRVPDSSWEAIYYGDRGQESLAMKN